MIVHNGRTIVPRGSHIIQENDRVVVFSLPSSIEAVEKLFK
jgi:trk system potassium uptake protein TrkA